MVLTQNQFSQLIQSVTLALSQRDLERALVQKDRVMREGTAEMKGQCLFYVGLIHESCGNMQAAQQEWLDALSYAGAGTFLRYSLEAQIGSTCERFGEIDQALAWYRHALETCAGGDEFSGNQVLSAILRLNGTIASQDETVVRTVIEKSWRVLQVPGSLDPENLDGSIRILSDWFSSRVKENTDPG